MAEGPRRPAPRSIRRSLLLALLTAVAATWLATAVVSYVDARHELDELLDAHLAQAASLLAAQAGPGSDAVAVEHPPQLARYGRQVAFQLWEGGTVLRLHSANAPDARLSPRAEGFSDVALGGERWRVFSGWNAGRTLLVQVGERREARAEIVATIAENLLWPLAVALPVLALLIWLGIDRALRPLAALRREVEARAPDKLDPLDPGGVPPEVAPLVASLDRLFARVAASIEGERRFTADAAHELRTPLAALRAQAQVATGAVDDRERDRALAGVIEGCDRATHLVAQLLTLARLDPAAQRAGLARCDLAAVARAAAAEAVPAALARDVEIEVDAPAPVPVAGDANLLQVLARNLVDNAVRHGPAGATVRVRVARRAGTAALVVADDGPGIPEAGRAELGRRFHRLEGTEASGSGLGLSIARRIAEIHGATVAFGDTAPGRGLTVTVTFAAA